jgi:cystathionine gamma-synthase
MTTESDTNHTGPSTQAVHSGRSRQQPHHALTTPLFQTATYTFSDTADLVELMRSKALGESVERSEYGRYGNPTVRAVEARLARLEGAEDALLYASGMAAVTSTLLSMLPTGAHVILTNDCYRRTRDFALTFLKRLGIETTLVSINDCDELEAAIRPDTRLIVSESPTNPYLRVVDLVSLVRTAEKHGIKTIIDATFASPVNLRPLEYGVDLVVHSATKYLGGHNDLLAGVVAGSADLIGALRQSQGVLGGLVDPYTAWLLERGLKTLGLRIKRQNENALMVSRFLSDHPRVRQVWYPGLGTHPDYEVACAQLKGGGGVVSFEIDGSLEDTGRFIDALCIPTISPSFGGVESLVSQPAVMSYYDLSGDERREIGISDSLVRYAVGIEDASDLIHDLAQALASV